MVSGMQIDVSGIPELQAALRGISKDMVDKVAPAGLKGYLRVVTKAVKSEIPSNMKDARKAIGWRFKKKDRRTGKVLAKVGTGVGITSKSDRRLLLKGLKADRKGRGGVGISVQNIHWYIVGTKQRFTRSGADRGVMPANPVVKKGFAKSRSAALMKFKDLSEKALIRAAKKRRSRKRRRTR